MEGQDAGMARRGVIIAWILFAFAELLSAAEKPVWMGMSREELVDALGEPHSQVMRGESEILLYPGAVRFELQLGRVVVVHGYKGKVELAKPLPSAKESEVASTPAQAGATAQPSVPAEKATAQQGPSRGREPAVRGVGRQVKLPTYGDDAAPDAGRLLGAAGFVRHLHDPRWHYQLGASRSWVSFFGGVIGRMLLCLLGLWLAARVYDQDLGWGGVAAIAGIEAGLRLLVLELLFLTLFYSMPFYVIECVMAVIQTILVYFWLNTPSVWMAIRIVATAKAAIIAITFALFTAIIATAAT